jgi:SOS-response transcriptional repressor LexA
MLTPRQKELLDVIRQYIRTHGISPTHSELATLMGVGGGATLSKYLDRLVARGVIRRGARGFARNIELVEAPVSEEHCLGCCCQ